MDHPITASLLLVTIYANDLMTTNDGRSALMTLKANDDIYWILTTGYGLLGLDCLLPSL